MKPRTASSGLPSDVAGRLVGPRDHDDRQVELAGRFDLGVGRGRRRNSWRRRCRSLPFASKRWPRIAIERSARLEDLEVRRQSGLFGRIDGARDIACCGAGRRRARSWRPRLRKTRSGVLPERHGRRLGGRHDAASCRLPAAATAARTMERQRQRRSARRRRRRWPTCGRRRDAWRRSPHRPSRSRSYARKTLDAAEAADARGERLRPGIGRAAGERQGRVEARVAGQQGAPAPRLRSCRRERERALRDPDCHDK